MTESPFRVFAGDAPAPGNFYTQDIVLKDLLDRLLSSPARAWLEPQAASFGAVVAEKVSPLAAVADLLSPKLRNYDRWGNRVDEVDYHPAYREMERLAYGSGMIGLKYDPENRARFPGDLQVAGFALSFLFAQGEAGISCPACMTDGVARVLELNGSEAQKTRWIPRLAARETDRLLTGAMFLTEKQGGSDVGKNATRAIRGDSGAWKLEGQKWFCSNVDAGLKLVLARPDGAPEGTKGLGLFLLPHHRDDGSRNAIRIERLKEKLGVRSMASGECFLDGCDAELVGELSQGFKQMAEMLNLSRLWNAICSTAIMRRSIFEATTYLRRRVVFGKRGIEQGLVRENLADLNAEEIGAKHVVFTLAKSLDAADAGSERDAQLVRILTPLVKYWTAKLSVWAASEAIELVGGNGYIEESGIPRLLRDAQVLPVWEGTTNILVLDTLRVVSRSAAHEALAADIRARASRATGANEGAGRVAIDTLQKAFSDLAIIAAEGPDAASGVLKRFTDRLMVSYEIALLAEAASQGGPVAEILGAAARRLVRRHVDPDLRTSSDDLDLLANATVTSA